MTTDKPIPVTREFIMAFEKKHHMPGIIDIGVERGEFVIIDNDTEMIR